MARKTDTGTKTYILQLKGGNVRKITIPSSWKLTYGQVIPYNIQQNHGGSERTYALRIYEGNKENLRAMMTDVVAIRDESIFVMEKRTTVKRQAAQKQTNNGMKDVVVEARMTEWVNPDADEDQPGEEFLRLPASVEPF